MAMNGKNTSQKFTPSITVMLRNRSRELYQHLPEPGDTYLYRETELSKSTWCFLTEHDLLEEVEYVNQSDDYPDMDKGFNCTHVWRTPVDTWEKITEYADGESSHPCTEDGHRGLRNLGDGEYTCKNDACDRTFGRETAERIVEEM
jgi:hypothetical protein